MSRVGKKPVTIPAGVEVLIQDGVLTVKGPLGTLTRSIRPEVSINVEGGVATVSPLQSSLEAKALWGTYASHLENMVSGVQKTFQKKLILEGIGFKMEVKGSDLSMSLGFSHPVTVPIPEGLTAVVEKGTLTVSGINKELVGEFIAKVRALKKPEPYKGKGFRYEGEVIKMKQGKKSA